MNSITATSTRAPQGLRLLLSMIDVGNDDDAIHACARTIVDDLDRWRQGYQHLEPQQAVDAVFPELEEYPTEQTIMKAGLIIGMAVAWTLMTELNGGAR